MNEAPPQNTVSASTEWKKPNLALKKKKFGNRDKSSKPPLQKVPLQMKEAVPRQEEKAAINNIGLGLDDIEIEV